MLSVRLICVGKLGEKFWADAVKEYAKRLGAYCKLEIIELPEQRLPQEPSAGEIAQALDREAALIGLPLFLCFLFRFPVFCLCLRLPARLCLFFRFSHLLLQLLLFLI